MKYSTPFLIWKADLWTFFKKLKSQIQTRHLWSVWFFFSGPYLRVRTSWSVYIKRKSHHLQYLPPANMSSLTMKIYLLFIEINGYLPVNFYFNFLIRFLAWIFHSCLRWWIGATICTTSVRLTGLGKLHLYNSQRPMISMLYLSTHNPFDTQ